MTIPVPLDAETRRARKRKIRNRDTVIRQKRADAPSLDDVLAACEEETTPREKLVLLAVAVNPEAAIEDYAAWTAMGEGAVLEALHELLLEERVFKTVTGGYISSAAGEYL